MMRVSVVIPSHARPQKLAACVRALRGQGADEVLVGLDGPDAESVAAAESTGCESLRVFEFPKAGANEVRSELIARADGELIVLLNDDVVPRDGFIAAHVRMHKRERSIVAGYSPYVEVSEPTLLDRLVQGSGVVFFWPSMLAAEHDHDHGYRCAATLNLSVLRDDINAVGGFARSQGYYGHDDIELAFRMKERLGLPVRFYAEAVADHDHRHTAEELLRRDAMLGASMWHYAGVNPRFALDLNGQNVTDPDTLAYLATYCDREQRDARRGALSFIESSRLPAPEPVAEPVLQALALQHTVARRWLWRAGLLAAARGSFDADQALDALLSGELAAA